MKQKEYITKEKFKELEEELKFLKGTKRKEIAAELGQTSSMGDLKENAEYHQAREAQAELEHRIMIVENVLKTAEIITEGSKDVVGIGRSVTICKRGNEDCVTYKIVGAEESDSAQNKISTKSPLVSAMLGKKKGETFSFKAPAGQVDYKIINIE